MGKPVQNYETTPMDVTPATAFANFTIHVLQDLRKIQFSQYFSNHKIVFFSL